MPPRPAEGMAQAEVLYHLRHAIDAAILHPNKSNETMALTVVQTHPRAMRSSHVRQNLGARRWAWLNDHGVYEVRGDITPELIK